MKQEEEKAIGVPENAFRELKPGEVYNPDVYKRQTVHRLEIQCHTARTRIAFQEIVCTGIPE